ncbi:MAG: hypothetical protein EOL91_13280 [Actinobacteria bacterium]|nr:hypothetical protein [Actinomycetota bacterium]
MSVLAAVGLTAFIVGFALVALGIASTIFDERMRWDYVADVVAKVGLGLILGAVVISIIGIIGWVWSEVTW